MSNVRSYIIRRQFIYAMGARIDKSNGSRKNIINITDQKMNFTGKNKES